MSVSPMIKGSMVVVYHYVLEGGSCALEEFGYNGGMINKEKGQLDALKDSSKPLTLGDLARYTQETLLPAIDERFEKMATKEELARVEDKVLTALDENTKLLKDWREEQEVTSVANVRQDETIDNHGKRIVQLEKKTGIEQAVAQ